MTLWVTLVVFGGYVSLLIELVFLHVPSVASSRGIYLAPTQLVGGYSPKYQRLYGWPLAAKVLVFGVPLLIVYAVYTYPLLVGWWGADLLGDYVFHPFVLTDLLGAALIVGGRALALAAVSTIRRDNEQSGISFRLHTAGPFRRSRNPGLLGMYAFVVGLWLTAPSAAMLLGIFLYVLYMHLKVCMEEDFLTHKFGSTYVEYQLRTGRYLS
jgi:protein-S-isoprenylcysteine O-methyltransferase Ste14